MHIENNHAKAIGLDKIGSVGLILGIVGLVALGFGFSQNMTEGLQAYIFGYSFWLILSIGALGVTTLHHTVRGAWGLSILRLLEAASGAIMWLFLAVGFIPIAANLGAVYKWVDPAYMAESASLERKMFFLNPQGFFTRLVVYLLIYGIYAYFMRKSSVLQDANNDNRLAQTRTNWSAPYLAIFGLTTTLLSTDIWMSLNPHWFSHIFGAIFIVSGALMTFALCNMIVMRNADKSPYADVMNKGLSKDLGNFMFMFTCVWAYFSFSQYVIIYSGNLPEFTSFFVDRRSPQWGMVGLCLMFFSFLATFIVLLSPKVKATPKYLFWVAVWIFFWRVVDVYWVVMPFMRNEGFHVSPYDLCAWAGVGGFWMFIFSKVTQQASLLPTHDPRLVEAYEHA